MLFGNLKMFNYKNEFMLILIYSSFILKSKEEILLIKLLEYEYIKNFDLSFLNSLLNLKQLRI